MAFLANMEQRYLTGKQKFVEILEMSNKYHTTILCISALLYRIILDLLYIFAVSPRYAYAGLTVTPHEISYVLSWLLYFLVFLTLPKQENNIGSFCLNLQFVITVAPMLSYYGLKNQSTKYVTVVVVALLLQNWILRTNNKKKQISFCILGLKPYVTVFLPIFVFACSGILLFWSGFQGIKAFDFEVLYEIRSNASYPPLLPYFLSWITTLFIPFLLAISLSQKRYLSSIVYIIADLFIYMIMANKAIYLSLLVVLGAYVISAIKIPIKLLYNGFLALISLSLILFVSVRTIPGRTIAIIINSFLGMRFLFIPAQNKFLFYDCFSQYPKTFFSDGQIGHMFNLTYPYAGSLGQTIFAFDGGELFGSNSNTGYLGESYAQLGFVGLIVTAVMLAYIVKFISDNMTDEKYIPVFMAIMSVQFVVLNDGALLTTLLTGGLFIVILLSMIYSTPTTNYSCNEIEQQNGGTS